VAAIIARLEASARSVSGPGYAPTGSLGLRAAPRATLAVGSNVVHDFRNRNP